MCNDEIITELLGIQGWKVKNIELNNLNGNIKLELERREGVPYECVACGQFFTIIYDHCPARQIEDIDSRAKIMRGAPLECGPYTAWPCLLDDSFDALAFTGQHAKAGTEYSHLTHTW